MSDRTCRIGLAAALLAGALQLTGCATLFSGRDQGKLATEEVLAGLRGSDSAVARERYRELSGHIRNFGVVRPGIYRGAEPDSSDLRRLRDAGVVTVIDFRKDGDKVAAEAKICRSLGLAHYNLPWTGHEANVDPALIRGFFDIVGHDGNLPAFVHCHRGAERTGTMIALYRIAFQDWSAEEAYAEMRRYRFRDFWFRSLREFVLAYEKEREDYP